MVPSSLLIEFREAYAKHDGRIIWLEIARPGTIDYSGNHEFIGLPALPIVSEKQYEYEMWLGFADEAETAAKDFRSLASRAGAYLSKDLKAELVGNNRGKGAAELWCLLLFHDYAGNLDDSVLDLIGEGCGHGMLFPPWMQPYPYSIDLIERLMTENVNATEETASTELTGDSIGDQTEGGLMTSATRDQVFISYSHKDKKWLDQLLTHLKPHAGNSSLSWWSDLQIKPGSQWFDEIQQALARTKVAVLLVSPDFLASDFIQQHELTPLLKDAESGGVTILWVHVRASSFESSPLSAYQALGDPKEPISKLRGRRDEVFVNICKGIVDAVNPQ